MPLLIGAGVVVVLVLVLIMQSGGGDKANAGESTPRQAEPAAKQPAPSVTGEKVQLGAAKPGKTPTKPAPALTQDTLQELSDLLQQIKALRNEAVTARTGNADNQLARSKMGEAKELLDRWEQMIEPQLRWQEEAQMGDWAQPAEYLTLERLYASFQRFNNEVRKGGG
ncbi:MAG: hypothetical protein AB7O97_11605 [Planctomycetota bacterium]